MPLAPHRALRRVDNQGSRLPTVPALHELERRFGVSFRRGQLVMVTGRPGAGKSNFVQWLVNQWPDVRTLYNSYDMPAFTAAVRQAAIQTGARTQDISASLDGELEGGDYYLDALSESQVEFCFDRGPDLPAIMDELNAWVEKYDAYPDALVFDNLLNVDGAEEDHHAQKFILRELQKLASSTGILVFVLHHAKEGVTDTSRPPAMRDTDGKVNQPADLILAVANAHDRFNLAVVKHRNGIDDPGADSPITLYVDLARVSFSANRPTPTWGGGWSPDAD